MICEVLLLFTTVCYVIKINANRCFFTYSWDFVQDPD